MTHGKGMQSYLCMMAVRLLADEAGAQRHRQSIYLALRPHR